MESHKTEHPNISRITSSSLSTSHDSIAAAEMFWAGALAGLIAETVMHPFDTVSHRAKVHPSSGYGTFAGAFSLLYKQEGIKGYFAGLSATLAQSPPSTAVYFLTYEYAKAVGLRIMGPEHADTVYFTAGATSELFASLVFVPLEVVKSRLQLGNNPHRATGGIVASHTNFPSIRAALAGIYAERGIAGLTAGWKSGLIQDIVYSATQFLLYENIKQKFEQRSGKRVSTKETLICGCISGGLAAAITNPFDVVTSRLMIQDGQSTGYGQSMMSVAKSTLAEGPYAIWRGTFPRVAQIAPLSAIAFAVYEGMRGWFKDTGIMNRIADGENPFASG